MKCAKCGYQNDGAALVCGLCGDLLPKRRANELLPETAAKLKAMPAPPAARPPPEKPVPEPESALDSGALHVLSCPIFAEPVVLTEGDRITLGRGKDCSVVFPTIQVSRVHAEVVRSGGAASSTDVVVRDLDSRNGTLVNGERVKERRLAPGDRITIGPFDLTYSVVAEGELARTRGGDWTGKLGDSTREVSDTTDGAFVGNLARIGVAEILPLLEHNRKTGVLTASQGDERGRVFLLEGNVVAAELGDTEGEEAVYALLAFKDGNFKFESCFFERKPSIQAPVAKLLLEGMRRLDHAAEKRETPPPKTKSKPPPAK